MRTTLHLLLWVLSAAVMIALAFLPIDARTQLVTTVLVIVVMAAMKYMRVEGAGRLVLLALGTSIVWRYVYWRTTSTLPPVNQLSNFVPGLLLYLAEM